MTRDDAIATLPKRHVLLLNGFGTNLGDQAITAGFLRLFSAAADGVADVTFDHHFIFSYAIRAADIERINATYDLIVLCGGGFLYDRPDESTASGWGFDVPEELLGALTVPIAVYGAGYNYRRFSEPHFPEFTASHVRETVARSAHFSVREHGSARMLREAFEVDHEVDVVPDCALHVEPHYVDLSDKRPSVAVCLRLDRPHHRFPPPFPESLRDFMAALVVALKHLVESGYQVVYTPHLLTSHDVEAGDLLAANLPAESFVRLYDALPSLYGAGVDLKRPSVLAGVYEQMDVVIGQRLHSLVVPFAVGTPCVSMTSIDTSAWMQAELGNPAWMHIDSSVPVSAKQIVDAVTRASAEREAWRGPALERRDALRARGEAAMRRMVVETLGGSDAG